MWRPYLLGRRYQIWTNQKSLKFFFLEQQVVTLEQQKWVSKLLGYDYKIIYRPGKTNSAADALSRRPSQPADMLIAPTDVEPRDCPIDYSETQLHTISSPHFHLWAELRHVNQTDPDMVALHEKYSSQPEKHPYLLDREGLLLYRGRIVIPPSSSLCTKLLEEFHNSKMGGHSGVLRTYNRIAQSFY